MLVNRSKLVKLKPRFIERLTMQKCYVHLYRSNNLTQKSNLGGSLSLRLLSLTFFSSRSKQYHLKYIKELLLQFDFLLLIGPLCLRMDHKTDQCTSFGINNENLSTIYNGLLEKHCSIYTAEAFAIKITVVHCLKLKETFIICSDTQYTLSAISHTRNSGYIITNSRNYLIKSSYKIRLMWVPGHAVIKGNETADKVASDAQRKPLLLFHTQENKDLKLVEHVHVTKM